MTCEYLKNRTEDTSETVPTCTHPLANNGDFTVGPRMCEEAPHLCSYIRIIRIEEMLANYLKEY